MFTGIFEYFFLGPEVSAIKMSLLKFSFEYLRLLKAKREKWVSAL